MTVATAVLRNNRTTRVVRSGTDVPVRLAQTDPAPPTDETIVGHSAPTTGSGLDAQVDALEGGPGFGLGPVDAADGAHVDGEGQGRGGHGVLMQAGWRWAPGPAVPSPRAVHRKAAHAEAACQRMNVG